MSVNWSNVIKYTNNTWHCAWSVRAMKVYVKQDNYFNGTAATPEKSEVYPLTATV